MKPDQRIIARTPLVELWTDHGSFAAERIRHLSENDLRELVRTVPLQFVVANVGNKLTWVPKDERFDFWKSVRSQIAEPFKADPFGSVPARNRVLRIRMAHAHSFHRLTTSCFPPRNLIELNRKASGFPISAMSGELSGCYGLVLTFVSSLSFLRRSCGQARVY